MKYIDSPNQKYHVLARGVILSEGHLLVAHCIGMDNTFLPGGHIEFHEGMKTTLSREIEEELGLASEVEEYLGAVEAEFNNSNIYHQEINHLFSVTIPEIDYRQNPESKEDHLRFYWIPIDEMEKHNLQPYLARDLIKRFAEGQQSSYWASTFENSSVRSQDDNHFPVLETERLLLRQLRYEDSAELFHYFSMDEVTKFYDLESFTDQKQAEDLIRNWKIRFDKQQGIRWGITFKSEDRIIGTCGFHNWSKEHYKAEIGYELTPEYWRQGLMTEVLQAVVKHGFEKLQLRRIEAFIDPQNISSRKLLEKSGFSEEGLLKDCYFEKNKFVDAAIFAILNK